MTSPVPSSSSFSGSERRRRIAILTDLHRPLQDHWNGRYVFLDANESEFNYKHHLTKLKDIYTSYQSEFLANANTDVSAKFKGGRKISTKLYGKHGLKSTAPFMPEWEKNREKLWDDDVKTREIPQISKHPRKKSETDAKENNKESSKAPRPTTRETPANSREGDSEGIVEPNWLRYKCSEEISEEDATMLGLYRLTDSQNEEYLRFVQILSEFDPFEMKKILHDAYSDARSLNSLESYVGTNPPPRVNKR